jgi:hypothetical protein
MDATETEGLKALGLEEMNCVVVSTGPNILKTIIRIFHYSNIPNRAKPYVVLLHFVKKSDTLLLLSQLKHSCITKI